MKKKIYILALVIFVCFLVITSCNTSETLQYNETLSNNGNWKLVEGSIDLNEKGDDSLFFEFQYIGENKIEENESWSCKIETLDSDGNTEQLYTTSVVYLRDEINPLDLRTVKRDDTFDNKATLEQIKQLIIEIEYTKNGEKISDVIKISYDK